jgi:hypothetical protein
MKIEKIYFTKLLEKKSELELSQKKLKRIEELEEKFKDIILFEKKIYEQKSKYYLQNKIKKGTDDIQDTLRRQIDNLNSMYEDNMYFLHIDKSILNKEQNKHIYNIYTVSIIEYKKINLFYDIILESDDTFYKEHFLPITLANLNTDLKLYLYELIDDTLNYSEIYAEYNEIDGTDLKNYNKYLSYLRNIILDFFIDLYSNTNKNILKMRENFQKLESQLCCVNNIPIFETLEKYQTPDNESIINEIIDIVVSLDWTIDMSLLNVETLMRIKD